MTDQNQNVDEQNENELDEQKSKEQEQQQQQRDPAEMTEEERVAAAVALALKPVKEKLDAAFKARDDAQKEVDRLAKEKRDAELKRLEDDGKHREAAEMRLAEAEEAKAAAEREKDEAKAEVLKLRRDLKLETALNGLTFRNAKAAGQAFNEMVSDLVQDANGLWVHKTGISIEDAVKAFGEDKDNAWLLKPKASSGGGADPVKQTTELKKETSLFGLTQEQVLAAAAKGQLPRRRRR